MVFSVSSRFSVQSYNPVGGLFSDAFSKKNILTHIASKYLAAEQNLKEVVRKFPYAELIKNPFQLAEGVMWGSCWIWTLYDFCSHACEFRRIAGMDLAHSDNRIKLCEQVKEIFVRFVSLSGMSASAVQWADRVRIIALGKFAPFVQKFSYVTILISAGFGIEKTIKALQKEASDFESERNPGARNKHKHHYRLALIDLASHISTVAWVVLGAFEICAGVALSPLLTGSVLMISCAFACTSLGYGLYIAFKVDPLAPPQAPVQVVETPQLPTHLNIPAAAS
jgi:hypothetical protein